MAQGLVGTLDWNVGHGRDRWKKRREKISFVMQTYQRRSLAMRANPAASPSPPFQLRIGHPLREMIPAGQD